jgi:hypothetical protein
VIVKYFTSKRSAELWAWGFAYARRVSKLPPLTVVKVDTKDKFRWGVDNPDYRDDLYQLDARRRVESNGGPTPPLGRTRWPPAASRPARAGATNPSPGRLKMRTRAPFRSVPPSGLGQQAFGCCSGAVAEAWTAAHGTPG